MDRQEEARHIDNFVIIGRNGPNYQLNRSVIVRIEGRIIIDCERMHGVINKVKNRRSVVVLST